MIAFGYRRPATGLADQINSLMDMQWDCNPKTERKGDMPAFMSMSLFAYGSARIVTSIQ
jgi:hypothetical protein